MRNYEALFVPGLLQTVEYARSIIQGVAPTVSEAELDNLVATRIARQTVLTRVGVPQFFAVVDFWRRRPIWPPTGWRWGLFCAQPLRPLQRPS